MRPVKMIPGIKSGGWRGRRDVLQPKRCKTIQVQAAPSAQHARIVLCNRFALIDNAIIIGLLSSLRD